MKTVTSISGGKTSAYVASKYPSDYNVFSLVRIEDKGAAFPDKKIRKLVEDRIQKPFIATAEDDTIIYTILDLEQHIGNKIHWVTGDTFDAVIRKKGNYLPNKSQRFCTSEMKLKPIFYWWAETIGEPIIMQIGYRANEQKRAKKMLDKCNSNGLLEYKATFGKHPNGTNKWEQIEWQKPSFPLIDNAVFRDQIENYWAGQTTRFADYNNCVGCFHRNPLFLRKMWEKHPEKMDWFESKEKGPNSPKWRSDISYSKIKQHRFQFELELSSFSDCDSGYCGY